MAKFIGKILLFFALLTVIDIVCGYGFNVLKKNAMGGDTRKNYFIAEECCDEILVLGSSRAVRHYDPQIIEDKLRESCYNCGEPGCGIITAYARYRLVASRKKPKVVLYEVTPRFDYYKTDDYSKYLGRVRQYSDKPVIRNLFIELGDDLEKIRLLSKMYQNNSCIANNIIDNISGSNVIDGYKPLRGKMAPGAYQPNDYSVCGIDSVKLSYIEKLIVELQKDGVKLFFIVSPKAISKEAAEMEKAEYEPIISLCNQYGIPFFNHLYMESISDNIQYFHDFHHLNFEGAKKYTEEICSELLNFN